MCVSPNGLSMTNPTDPPRRRTAAEERAERLAAQLRANLQRRKQQTRGRRAATPETGDDEPPIGDDRG